MKRCLILSAAALVAGCASDIETRISSSGIASPRPQAYMVSTVAETSPELRTAHMLVATILAQKGFNVARQAALHAEITLDARDASLAINAGTGDMSVRKRRKSHQGCKEREYRFGITLTSVEDGAEIYRGRAAETHCRMTVTEVLPAMVAVALADLGNPRGSYTVLRKAKD